ncbi:hypothetical protein C6401_15220 [Arthrobacter woluwensis]|uniref:hypothetical protein n=1 Tax=Arthrobacter woluwensis TaxID=156980 RepID=UPI000D12956A|nr:hypothetical protein [Arthrobacter woluwensis]PSS42908.1 hypothetical protein C6401_15220 [Arthrobacter woluwensis]
MAFDPNTDIGKVRLLIADLDETNQIFTDEMITGYLSLAEWNVHRAAASCLRTIATSEVLLSKKIRTQDLQTDGPAVAAELRAQAAALDEQAADGDTFFEIVPLCPYGKGEGAEWRFS